MTYRAVVFDLFGTLVDEFTVHDWERCYGGMADALGIAREAFRDEWEATAEERQTGRLGDMAGNLRFVAGRLGVEPSAGGVERALGVRSEVYLSRFAPKPGAVDTLRTLKERGYPIALVSNCAPDAPGLWRSSEMAALVEAEIFSTEVGLRKPDPAIYLIATRRLGVDPSACLYVGDGGSGELAAAAALGMIPVLMRDPNERDVEVWRPDADGWAGGTISSIPEVLELVRTP